MQNSEASATLVLSNEDGIYDVDGSGDLAIDKKVALQAGYSSTGDPAKSVAITGLISGIDEQQGAKDSRKALSVKVLSPFKNTQKLKITTDYFEDETGETICNSIVADFMGWANYDFSACTTTFTKIRFENESPKTILQKVCEACSCDLIVGSDGTITAVAFPNFDAAADYSYAKEEISELNSADALDISVVNTLNLKGKMFAPDEVAEIECYKHKHYWYGEIASSHFNPYAYFEIVFTRSPVYGARYEISACTNPETISFETLEVEEDRMTIFCTRSGPSKPGDVGYVDLHFVVTCYGRPYQDKDLNQLSLTAKNWTLLALYQNIVMEQDYENKVIQTLDALQSVGDYKLKQNLYMRNRKTWKTSHNPSLELNDIIDVETPTANLKCLVRSIQCSGNTQKSSLMDTLDTWVIASTESVVIGDYDGDGNLIDGGSEEVEIPAGIPDVNPDLPGANRLYLVNNAGDLLVDEAGELIYVEGG